MTGPRVDQINIVVEDMEAAVDFYRAIGFDIPDDDSEWQAHHRSGTTPNGVDVDLDSVAFARQWGNVEGPGVVIEVRFDTRDEVDATYAALTAAGHESIKEPHDAFWGSRFAIVRDPAGNRVGLMSVRDPAHRTPGPAGPPD